MKAAGFPALKTIALWTFRLIAATGPLYAAIASLAGLRGLQIFVVCPLALLTLLTALAEYVRGKMRRKPIEP